MRKLSLIALAVALVTLVPALCAQDTPPAIGNPDIDIPDFPEGLEWVNVPGPLSLEDLRGKVVLLDFWTYGCINCIHMIPVLEQLEAKYPDELVVIGVHSAKFSNEGETENIRQIVQRYDVHHPVINDHEFRVWQSWGVRAWPSFSIIDPLGNVMVFQSPFGQPSVTIAGEQPFNLFDTIIGDLVTYFDEQGQINREPLNITPESDRRPPSTLAFPGKVLADPASNRLFISDTNHNRIIIADLNTYEVLDVIGSGERGLVDGPFAQATFNKPQGMALIDNTLYVADTNNHVIRSVWLNTRQVTTIAGTGYQSRVRGQGGLALGTALASPWDVALGPDHQLYIAMAGPHQLWVLDLNISEVRPFVGSGIEGMVNDSFGQSQLAQPSGLYLRGDQLYFADSESSTIRAASLADQRVYTLAGTPLNNLFDFGDVDGALGVSRLQHALDVTGDENGLLYVADTYNSRIKVLDPATNEIHTLFGLGGLGGFRDGDASMAEFDEPGGMDYANGKLYVADTNNHAIRVIDLEAQSVSTVTFPNPEMLQIGSGALVVGGNAAFGLTVDLPPQTVAPGDGEIVLSIDLPEGYKLNDLAPFSSEWSHTGEALTLAAEDQAQFITLPDLPLTVPVKLQAGEDVLEADVTVYYCEAVNPTLCFIERVRLTAPVTVAEGAETSQIAVQHQIAVPEVLN